MPHSYIKMRHPKSGMPFPKPGKPLSRPGKPLPKPLKLQLSKFLELAAQDASEMCAVDVIFVSRRPVK